MKDRWREVTRDLGFGDKYKDVIVDTVMPIKTGDPITLYWKGPAPAEITAALEESGLDVVIRDGQPYSQTDFTAMQAKIHEALLSVGYQGLSSGVKYSDSGPILEVDVPSNVEPNWSRDQILDLLNKTVPEGAMKYIELNTEKVPLPQPA